MLLEVHDVWSNKPSSETSCAACYYFMVEPSSVKLKRLRYTFLQHHDQDAVLSGHF